MWYLRGRYVWHLIIQIYFTYISHRYLLQWRWWPTADLRGHPPRSPLICPLWLWNHPATAHAHMLPPCRPLAVALALLLAQAVFVAAAAAADVPLSPDAVLGPARVCRCLPAVHSATLLASSAVALSALSARAGAAEICYCETDRNEPFPQLQQQQQRAQDAAMHTSMSHSVPIDRPVTAGDVTSHLQQHLQHQVQQQQQHQLSSYSSSSSVNINNNNAAPVAHEKPTHAITERDTCAGGLTLDANYTVADWGTLSMCNTVLGRPVFASELTVNVRANQYACGHFRFAVYNGFGPSAIALYAVVGNVSYAAVAPDSPPLPPNVRPLQTYATWVFQTCDEVSVDMMMPARYVSDLDGPHSNEVFQKLARYGARPVGVQPGNVFPGGLQCLIVENPWCYWWGWALWVTACEPVLTMTRRRIDSWSAGLE